MNTLLEENTPQIPDTQVPNENVIRQDVTTNVPTHHVSSDTFLQNLTHTGYVVNVKLPIETDAGPVPLFAYRVSPQTWCYDVRAHNNDYPQAASSTTTDTNYIGKWAADETIHAMINVRPFANSTVSVVGCESPQSLMSKLYRFNRVDMVYALRFQGEYTGSGLIQVVPVKGVPRGHIPFATSILGGSFASGSMNNSYALADYSKSREMKFVYPYEYNTEYQDFVMDCRNYDAFVGGGTSWDRAYHWQMDNWFVVLARGPFRSTNTQEISLYIDHAFSKHQLHTPLLPFTFASQAVIPQWFFPVTPASEEENVEDAVKFAVYYQMFTSKEFPAQLPSWIHDIPSLDHFSPMLRKFVRLNNKVKDVPVVDP